MFFHLILTTECNLHCRYCYGEALEDVDTDFEEINVEYSLPRKIGYDMSTLDRFCSKDPDCVLTFYGGEPLLCIQEIKQIIDLVHARHFMLQTNGLLLDRISPEYVNRFHTILVSLDGNEALTDYYRGIGTFRKVIENLKTMKNNGYRGELIARMTVMEQTDLHNQVRWLLENDEFPFSSVHWQLNAGFWKSDFGRRRFSDWSRTSYNPDVRRLVRFWVDKMESEGKVVKLYPILGVAQSLLRGEKSHLRCGAGWTNYAIQTDGSIVPCPTMWGMTDYYLGNVRQTNPREMRRIFVGKPCTECESLDLCGGRCLYANVTRRWNTDAYALVCETVRNLIQSVSEEIPRIGRLIARGDIRLEDFEYLKYNGCEIIP
jgi:putative peptide-modifying radical SAM enzyme